MGNATISLSRVVFRTLLETSTVKIDGKGDKNAKKIGFTVGKETVYTYIKKGEAGKSIVKPMFLEYCSAFYESLVF